MEMLIPNFDTFLNHLFLNNLVRQIMQISQYISAYIYIYINCLTYNTSIQSWPGGSFSVARFSLFKHSLDILPANEATCC